MFIQGATFIPDSRVVSSPTNFSEFFFYFSVHMLEVESQQPSVLYWRLFDLKITLRLDKEFEPIVVA